MVCDKHQTMTHIMSCKADFGQCVGLTLKTTFVYLHVPFCRFSYTKRFRALRRCVSEGGHRSELNGAEENFHQVRPRPVKQCAWLCSVSITKLYSRLGQTWDHGAVENPSTASTRGGRRDGRSDEDQAPQAHGTGTGERD